MQAVPLDEGHGRWARPTCDLHATIGSASSGPERGAGAACAARARGDTGIMRIFIVFASATLFVVSLSIGIGACSSSPTNEPSATTGVSGAYRGLLTGTKETGILDVTLKTSTSSASMHPLAAGSPSTVTGTITFLAGGQPVTLTGTYDASTGSLSLTGTTARGTYTLNGASSSAGFSGTYGGPNGSGTFSLASATSGQAKLYCGTYAAGGAPLGVWNLVIDASGNATGAHCDASSCGALVGTAQGASLTLRDPSESVTATGTIANDAASGSWKASDSSGTWAGSTSACQATATLDGGSDASSDAGDGGDNGPGPIETLLTELNEPVSSRSTPPTSTGSQVVTRKSLGAPAFGAAPPKRSSRGCRSRAASPSLQARSTTRTRSAT